MPIFGYSVAFALMAAATLLPLDAHADWKIYYSGKAAKMFGSHGRGNFATRSQCESYRVSRPGFESNNSHCSGFDAAGSEPVRSQQAKTPPALQLPSAHQDGQALQQLQREQETAKRNFSGEKESLLKALKDPAASDPAGTANSTSHRDFFTTDSPSAPVRQWSSAQCALAQQRVDTYRQALSQSAEVAGRLGRTIASDQALRQEWEQTMNAAVERAKDRGQFLWLALPLGKLKQLNDLAGKKIGREAGELADLLAGTTDPRQRDRIRMVRQFNRREQELIADLGKKYEHIDDAVTLGGNAPLMLEDPAESPTSMFRGNGMKLRETGEMLFGLIVERDAWKKMAGSHAWANYLAGGLAVAFQTEAAARAMFDSWYDALATALAWKQITQANHNADSYLAAVKSLDVEIRKRGERLKTAEAEFKRECAAP